MSNAYDRFAKNTRIPRTTAYDCTIKIFKAAVEGFAVVQLPLLVRCDSERVVVKIAVSHQLFAR